VIHEVCDPIEIAARRKQQGADELSFYDTVAANVGCDGIWFGFVCGIEAALRGCSRGPDSVAAATEQAHARRPLRPTASLV
jgi:hypothetical protein